MNLVESMKFMRIRVLASEDYSGDEVKYTATDIFIITTGKKELEVLDVNLTEQYFIIPKGKVP